MQYIGNSQSDMWKYLDDVEQLYQGTPAQTQESLNEVGDVYEVMEEIAKTPDGVRNLVDRYSHTPSRHIWVYLAGTVGSALFICIDEKPRDMVKLDEMVTLYFQLFKDVRWLVITPDMLMGMLGGISKVIESGFWDTQETPAILYDVLQRSLTYGWGIQVKADYVSLAAINLLSLMCQTGLMERDFSSSQIEWLHQEIIRFASKQNAGGNVQEEALEATAKFFQCLNTRVLI